MIGTAPMRCPDQAPANPGPATVDEPGTWPAKLMSHVQEAVTKAVVEGRGTDALALFTLFERLLS